MKKSPAFKFIEQAWKAIPSGSWQRINGGMFSALSNAVNSGMKFNPGDIKLISKSFSGHYWMGDGEGLYANACGGERGTKNPSATAAYENYFGREPWLWPEASKTPERLHRGSRFTWNGELVTVTSFKDSDQSLIACTYKERDDDWEYVDDRKRKLLSEKISKDGNLTKKYSAPATKEYETEKIRKRYTITHAELMAVRKAADAKVRAYLKEFATVSELSALGGIWMRASADGTTFRHFDIEELRAAFKQANERIREALTPVQREELHRREDAERAATYDADLKRWMKGERVNRHFEEVRLRLMDGRVETTTNQHATPAGSRKAYRFAMKHRVVGWTANGETQSLDQFPIQRINSEGVQVGCTFIEWREIDRFAKQQGWNK